MALDFSPGDEFVACIPCTAVDKPCVVCGQVFYRLISILRQDSSQENVTLCGRHYLDLLSLRSDLAVLEKRPTKPSLVR